MFGKIDAIWAKEGFLEPSELTKRLLVSQLEPSPDQAYQENMIDNLLSKAYPRDQLTGFADKPETPLLTGLCHLYAQRTGVSVNIVDGDYGNMGGTNLFYKQEMGGHRHDDGFAETDLAARVTARIAEQSLNELVAQYEGAKLMSVRSGGDEIRFLTIGVPQDAVEDWLVTKTHPAIERFTAEANLHNHTHLKAPDNRLKDGFGLALACESLNRDDIKPDVIITNLDEKINAEKLVLGGERRGEVVNSGDYDPETLSDEQLRVKIQARQFDALKKQGGDGLSFIHNLDQHPVYADMAKPPPHDPDLPIQMDITAFIDRPFTDLFVRMHKQMDGDLTDQCPNLSEQNRMILHSALDRAMPVDHSAGVYGPRYLEATATSFFHDAKRLGSDPAHLAHLEFGNLAGLNLISHMYGDAVLGEIGGNIIKEEMEKFGLKVSKESVFHRGGARFNVPLPNYGKKDSSDNRFHYFVVDDEKIEQLGHRIAHRIDTEINNQSMAEFFKKKGLSIIRENEDGVVEYLKLGDGRPLVDAAGHEAKFSDMPHPKRAFERGIGFVITHIELDDSPMPKQISALNHKAEMTVNGIREERRPKNIAEQVNDNLPSPSASVQINVARPKPSVM